ncbi:hypothetical protein KIL84_017685 [Mauremys mutica]|uniref:Uncharacterized protein n=1 Tax=Mauremys mutica TaxID=74926 RepID=A0A9D3X6K0_9SAUR|nr:hypothetical protein KIL84_017685 [Mauremys mutica]
MLKAADVGPAVLWAVDEKGKQTAQAAWCMQHFPRTLYSAAPPTSAHHMPKSQAKSRAGGGQQKLRTKSSAAAQACAGIAPTLHPLYVNHAELSIRARRPLLNSAGNADLLDTWPS